MGERRVGRGSGGAPDDSTTPSPSGVTDLELTLSEKTQCERDDVLFMLVSCTCRRSCARVIRRSTSLALVTACSESPLTKVPRVRPPTIFVVSSTITSSSPLWPAALPPGPKPPFLDAAVGSSTSRSVISSL